MSKPTHAVSKDREHDACVTRLESIGLLVEDVSHAGGGVLDLIVGNPANLRFMLMEIKNKPDRPSDVRFTPKQKSFLKKWAAFPVRVAYGPDDAEATARRELGNAPPPAPADETPLEKLRRLATSATRRGSTK